MNPTQCLPRSRLAQPPTFWVAKFVSKRCLFAILGILSFPAIIVYMLFRDFVSQEYKTKYETTTSHSSCKPIPSVFVNQSWLTYVQGSATTALAWVADTVVYISELAPSNLGRIGQFFTYGYPPPFFSTLIPVGEDMGKSNTTLYLSCKVGIQPEKPRMTIILIPGMFNAASMSIFVSLATSIYYEWGANVIVCELRGHGETGRQQLHLPFSLTVLEAHDILSVACYAREHYQQDAIFLLGLSLGGTSALSAAVEDKENLIQGMAMLSSPMDIVRMMERMSLPSTASFNMWYSFYKWLLLRYCRLRGISSSCFNSFVHEVVIPPYKDHPITVHPSSASPIHRLGQLKCPALALYAEDDPVTTTEEASILKHQSQLCKKAALLEIQITPYGGHAGHFLVNHRGTSRRLYSFFARHISDGSKSGDDDIQQSGTAAARRMHVSS